MRESPPQRTSGRDWPNEAAMSTQNPTLDPTTLSKTIVQETIRPGLESYAETNSLDAGDVDRSGDRRAPLVVTAYPDKPLYPHVVVDEDTATGSKIDERHDFLQWDFSVRVECHGRSSTEMFTLKDGVRGYFATQQDELRDAGFADVSVDGSPATWDATADVASWQLTVTGLVHTHKDAND